jgi:hypothetical protein
LHRGKRFLRRKAQAGAPRESDLCPLRVAAHRVVCGNIPPVRDRVACSETP